MDYFSGRVCRGRNLTQTPQYPTFLFFPIVFQLVRLLFIMLRNVQKMVIFRVQKGGGGGHKLVYGHLLEILR